MTVLLPRNNTCSRFQDWIYTLPHLNAAAMPNMEGSATKNAFLYVKALIELS